MNKARTLCAVCAGLLALLLPRPAAAWPDDPNANVPLCTATGHQFTPAIVSDGAGGAIVTWTDSRSGNYDIYARRISANGTALWTADGVALCTATGDQESPRIVSDGAGGAIVTWYDGRAGTSDIYAQRISAAGTPQWTADGVALCAATGDQTAPTITADGAGGAIVTWTDYRNGTTNSDIYAQRISAGGTALWTADGVALCTATSYQSGPIIAPDGAGGAIITWKDHRSDYYGDIYAQRILAAGTPQWTAGGVALCTAAGGQSDPTIVADDAGGAIVTWTDERSGFGSYDIYAQRISAAATPQWTADGVALCTATNEQYLPTIVSDGAGGAIVTWIDSRSGAYDIYTRRISANGTALWTADGVALCTATGTQYSPSIVPDGAGGAIVTWHDYRNGNNFVIYAQRISAAGAAQWTAGGVALCTTLGHKTFPTIIPDGAGGAIVTWQDARSVDNDIYAQNVKANGELGGDAGAGGAQAPDYLGQWGTNGTGDGQFDFPYGVAVDASGNVYVADRGNHRIQKFTSSGGYLTQWGSLGGGEGQFNYPQYVAVDALGNVYVTDYSSNSRLQKFTSDGTYLTEWPVGGSLQGVVVDSSGNVYVADLGNYKIQKFTSDGDYLAQWGSLGGGDGQFTVPQGVAVDAGGNVYVTDGDACRIQKFTSSGGYLTQWGTRGRGDGQFYDPRGVAVDASGNVYVADYGNNRIQKFTSSGTYLTQWGTEGSGDGQFNGPLGVAVDASGNVYVADAYNNRIQKFGPAPTGVPAEASLAFTLDPVRPNPSRGGALTVHFSLPTDAPARVELLDVAGRRIASHEVGAGQHTLDLGAGRRLAPGLYFVRLTQGANTRTTRAAVLR